MIGQENRAMWEKSQQPSSLMIQISRATPPEPRPSTAGFQKARAYMELTKPRLTSVILLVSLAGFCLGSNRSPDPIQLLYTMVGVSLLAAGIFALNQYLERDIDGIMRRTKNRPLPSGRLEPRRALGFGVLTSVTAVLSLTLLVNPLSGGLAVFTLVSYLFVYTPLKTKSSLCTLVGALPGAMPPFLGWAAARGELGVGAWVLFAILILWQYPHLLAIGWLHREDYGRAGVRILPVVKPDGKLAARQIVTCTLLLLVVSLTPTAVGLAGFIYLLGALTMGSLFLAVSIRMAISRTQFEARLLLLASVLYLPLLFALMVVNPTGYELGLRNQSLILNHPAPCLCELIRCNRRDS
jgi:heme o synthase